MTHNDTVTLECEQCPLGITAGCPNCDLYDICELEQCEHVTSSDTVDVCAVIYDVSDDTVEQCDYCGGIATRECPVCHAMICDNHIEHKSLAYAITHINVKWDEPNLTVFQCKQLTVAIAHDGTIDTMRTMRQIVDMVKRFRLHHVTCITLVIAPFHPYRVESVTLSQSVWNINCQSVPQITMAINTIGLAHG